MYLHPRSGEWGSGSGTSHGVASRRWLPKKASLEEVFPFPLRWVSYLPSEPRSVLPIQVVGFLLATGVKRIYTLLREQGLRPLAHSDAVSRRWLPKKASLEEVFPFPLRWVSYLPSEPRSVLPIQVVGYLLATCVTKVT